MAYNTLEKYGDYLRSKMMHKMAWWIEPLKLPKVNDDMYIDAFELSDKGINIHPWGHWHQHIFDYPFDQLPHAIQELFNKHKLQYVSWSTMDHNWGCLLSYKREGDRYVLSRDPEQIDNDVIAQDIMDTFIDKKFTIKL